MCSSSFDHSNRSWIRLWIIHRHSIVQSNRWRRAIFWSKVHHRFRLWWYIFAFAFYQMKEKYNVDSFNCSNLIPIVIFRTSKGLRTAIYVLFGLVITYILVTAIIVQLYSSTVIIKSASVLFCNLILIFNITMAVGSLFYTMSPEKGWVSHSWYLNDL